MAGIVLSTGVGANGETVIDTNGDLHVRTPITEILAGFVSLSGENDPGTITGTRYVKAIEVSEDFRVRVGTDTPFFSEWFQGSAINTSIWGSVLTTATLTVTNGYANLNAAGSVASGAIARMYTHRSFPIIGCSGVRMRARVQFTQTPVASNRCWWGLFHDGGVSGPADGVYFEYDSSGNFRCVVNFNSTVNTSSALNAATLVGTDTSHNFDIDLSEHEVHFWIDDILVWEYEVPAAAAAVITTSQRATFVNHNLGATSVAQIMKVSFCAVLQQDINGNKMWGDTIVGMGGSASQGQTGGTIGQTANYANSANPTAAVPTNTTAALGTGLGGQFWETASLAVNTDGILCSYQVPAFGTVGSAAKGLYITQVTLNSYIQTVIAGGPFVAQIALAYGHTAVSLATAEAAAAKAPRRIPLGIQLVTAAQAVSTVVGPAPISVQFNPPVYVAPGEFVQVITKHVGTVGTTGTIAHVIGFNGYWE